MNWALEVAARTLCQEARGEPLTGQQAVACVIKNRLRDGRWGKSLASVCLWPHQFSGWASFKDPNFAYACDLPDDDPTLSHMMSVMQVAMDSPTDFTKGATHYFALSIAAPAWVLGATQIGKFGNQMFYRDVK